MTHIDSQRVLQKIPPFQPHCYRSIDSLLCSMFLLHLINQTLKTVLPFTLRKLLFEQFLDNIFEPKKLHPAKIQNSTLKHFQAILSCSMVYLNIQKINWTDCYKI